MSTDFKTSVAFGAKSNSMKSFSLVSIWKYSIFDNFSQNSYLYMSEFEAELGLLIGDVRFDKIQQAGSSNANYEI